jgi:histidine triad (HIT) family protein
MTDRSCDFCEIVARRLPAAILFEDELTMSFLDITAVNEGHTLVIPKPHWVDIWDVPEDSAVAVMGTARRMAARIREVLAPEGLTLFQANRAVGWQDVFHFHLHLVPRWPGDRLTRPWTGAPVELKTLLPVRSRLALTERL